MDWSGKVAISGLVLGCISFIWTLIQEIIRRKFEKRVLATEFLLPEIKEMLEKTIKYQFDKVEFEIAPFNCENNIQDLLNYYKDKEPTLRVMGHGKIYDNLMSSFQQKEFEKQQTY